MSQQRQTLDEGPGLTLAEARKYLLGLINEDRAALHLRPVELDPLASEVGQAQAEEMATHHFLAHKDLQGRLPDERYTEHGGRDHVKENVYLYSTYVGERPAGSYTLEADQRFTRRELADLEAAYFNQHPPNDGHRKNIADWPHTHVGIGLAHAHLGVFSGTLANAEEFVDRYLDVDAMPSHVRMGERVAVTGRIPDGLAFRAIEVGREPLPHAASPAELNSTAHYPVPAPFARYLEQGLGTSPEVELRPDGRFRVELPLSQDGQPGVYYVIVKVADRDGRAIVASQRTVVVE